MIQCITVDLDGVLFLKNGIPELFDYFNKLGVSSKDFSDFYYNSDIRDSFKTGRLSEKDYWNIIKNKFSIEFDLKKIYEVIGENSKINYKLLNFLYKQKEKGITIGICSNLFPTHVSAREYSNKEPKNFDFKIYSFEVGVTKPNKKMFKFILEKSNLLPKNILYVDDNPKRISGARDLSIKTYIYTTFLEFQLYFNKLTHE